jgi:V8-like Glu-specific endopeptidase
MKLPLQIFKVAMIISAFLFTSSALSQTAEIPFHYEQYQLESGYHNGNGIQGSEAVNVFTGTVEMQDIPWLSLHFSEANLGENSYLIITSLYDDHWQKLDKVSIVQWNYYSAFFNGGTVEIKLFAAPDDKKIFFAIDELTIGDWVNDYQTDSQCGPTDDRILSDQHATGRLINVGCTAWIIPNGSFVSAGHCLSGSSANVVEFQVPPSLPNGTIQHPGPEDQYSVDVSTKVFVNGGVGNDWGVFKVFPNSITGLMPIVAQGAYWPLVQDLGPDSIRITGYGVDSGVNNQVQQTHVGPNAGSSGTTMRYVTDTEGGNSGSPVIDELTGNALGVHTHGGCSTSGGNNNGTSFFNSAFWNAVEQGTPVELTSFTADVNEANVTLSWSTATETNNQGFEVQRSKSEGEFETVTFVNGNGTTTEMQYYSYTDAGLREGVYNYRLKQVNFDGSYEYTNVILAEVVVPDVYLLEQNYPNPFNPGTKIKFMLAADSKVSLKVFDVLGQEVMVLINSNLVAGGHEVNFDASGLNSGVYFYKIEATGVDGSNFVDVKKMILTK